jgi:peptide/nickel transport system substrate-binding protein
MNKKLFLLLSLIAVFAVILAACSPAAPEKEVVVETVVVEKEGETVIETVVVEKEGETVVETVEVVVEVTPEPVTRQGAWLDTVIMVEEPDSNAAVTRIQASDIDVYAFNIAEPDVAQRVFAADDIVYQSSYGNFNDIRFMPSTTKEFSDGRLNPFFSPKIREAMNWLMDRDYITQEISGGLAVPRFVPINYASKDSALLADSIAAIELKYAHNPDKALEVINAEMEALGAEMIDGKWQYNGEPVVLTGLIRIEDERLPIGDYMSNLFEDIGFEVQRDYKSAAEASPCWLRGNPDDGCAHFYTGGWVSTALNRDASTNFSFFYTPDGLPFPPWQAYDPSPDFYDVASRLTNSDFVDLDEREVMMREALDHALVNSQAIWVKDDMGVAPHAPNVTLASDLSGSIYGSWLWAQTMRFTDKVGGSMTIATLSLMTEPWNPVSGTNWVYDMMPMRGIGDNAVVPDPYTGVTQPNRIERAEVYVQEGLPVVQNEEWAELIFVDEIVVPEDAWADWDAENQVFITAGERFTETTTTLSKVVMYYEEDLFNKMTWHDGSPLTLADFVMTMIMQFDQAKEASPYYDEATVPNLQTFMGAFKGWKIASENPLVIEFYTDAYALDAENNVTNLRSAYPCLGGVYTQGQGAWHNMSPALRMEGNGEATFSPDKAEGLGVEWMSWIAGPTLDLMTAQLQAARDEAWIPFEATLGQYITAEEADARYGNLQEWFRRYGHYYIGTGPFFLQKAFPVEGTLILQRNTEYPDMADKWDRYSSAPIPEIMIDGEDRVTIGEEVIYDVFVDLNGEPYAVDEIAMVRYLVFDATGELAEVGDGVAVEDGYWTVTLSEESTGGLTEGSNQLAVIVVSERALVPVRDTFQFVTSP